MYDISAPSRRNWLVAALCATTGVIAVSLYLQLSREVTYRFLMTAATVALIVPGAVFFSLRDRRTRVIGLVFGLLFTLAQVGSARLTEVGTLARAGYTGEDCVLLAFCVLGFTPAVGGVFALIVRGVESTINRNASREIKPQQQYCDTSRVRVVFLGCTVLLMLCWLPVFLAFYPGLFTYDVSYQYLQYSTSEFNTHHPLLHTLMVGGFIDIGRLIFNYPAKGIMLYTLFQMALMALSMAYALTFLYRRRAPRWFIVLTLVIFGLAPFSSLMAVSATKDTLFAGLVLHLCVLICEYMLETQTCRGKLWGARFALTAAGVCLMRNNGFVCLAALLIICLIAVLTRRGYFKRFIALSLCGLVLFGAGSAGLKLLTGAKNGPPGEALSIPAQQLARVYVLTDDPAKPEIVKWLPDADKYAWSLADHVKNTYMPNPSGGGGLLAFIGLWADVGLRHPVVYLDAFGLLMGDFFNLDGHLASGGQYLETAFHEDKGEWLIESSKWPWLKQEMARLYSRNEYQEIPLFTTVLSHAFWCWLMLIAFALAVCLRRRAALLACAVVFTLYLSVLLGPCVMLRYIYPIIICVPLLWGVLLLPRPDGSKQSA